MERRENFLRECARFSRHTPRSRARARARLHTLLRRYDDDQCETAAARNGGVVRGPRAAYANAGARWCVRKILQLHALVASMIFCFLIARFVSNTRARARCRRRRRRVSNRQLSAAAATLISEGRRRRSCCGH